MELGANSIHGRMISTQKSWIPNFGNAFGISQLESLAPIQLKGTADLIFNALADKKLNYTVPNAWPGISESGPYPSWQDYEARRVFYNLLAVRALVDTQGGWLSQRPMDGVVPVWSNEHHILYRDTHARARAYLVAAQEPKTAHGPELDRRPTMNVIQNIFELARKHDIVEGDVQVRKITPGLMQIDIRASKPALLVIADSYYPGWTALVDGRERRMARVAGALRGVFVRPEDRRVELRFRPKYLHALLWTSAAAFTVAVLLVISGGWHSRRFSLVSQRTRRRRSQPR